MTKKEIKDSGLTFQQFDDMSPIEKAKYEGEHPFEYNNIEEYIEDIIIWLCANYHDSKESAEERVRANYKWIEEDFANHTPVDSCAADVGYCCG